jgi:K+-sensing histidine kinase KdpD
MSEVLATLASQIAHVDGRVEVGELPTLQARRSGLFRVFQKLIANALKFNDGGRPHVTVSARHAEAGWTFSVRDNGDRPAQGQRESSRCSHAAGANTKAVGSASRRAGGSSRPTGEYLGGACPEGGSTFLFTLPV